MKKGLSLLCALVLLGLTGCLNNDLKIVDAWARPGTKGGNSAIYFGIDNPTDQTEVLLNATCDVAENTEIHLSKLDDQGLMTMEHQEAVTLNPRTQLKFEPGGLHVMLINLQRDLELGDNLLLRLNFQEAGEIEVSVKVKEQ